MRVLILLLAGAAFAQPHFSKPKIEWKATEPGHDVTIRFDRLVEAKDLPRGKVPYTAEAVGITMHSERGTMGEVQPFDSQFMFDFDASGLAADAFKYSCTDGVMTLNGWRFDPLGLPEMNYYVEGPKKARRSKVVRMGEKGNWGLLYRACGQEQKGYLGLDEKPIEVKTVKGPALQLLILEPVKLVSQKPRRSFGEIRLNGRRVKPKVNLTWSWEAVFGPKPVWGVLSWVMVPLDPAKKTHEVKLKVVGKLSYAHVLAITNVSPRPGVRLRGEVALETLR